MKLRNLFLGGWLVSALTTCQPIMALPKPTTTVVANASICKASNETAADVVKFIRDGRSNIEIMSWLDSITPDAQKEPQAYLGVILVKLDVSNLRVAINKAFKDTAILNKQLTNCLETSGQSFSTFEK